MVAEVVRRSKISYRDGNQCLHLSRKQASASIMQQLGDTEVGLIGQVIMSASTSVVFDTY